MKNSTQNFIQFCLDRKILKFGEFTLKSGRKSPYFFNLGLLHSGEDLRLIGQYYAALIQEHFASGTIDVIFGAAYKGIPLATATVIALAEKFSRNMGFAFNRKEAKDHGEGGVLVGAEMRGKNVLILDDLITAGTAIRHSMELLKHAGANVVGIALAINRQEKGVSGDSAVNEIQKEFSVPVCTIISLSDLITHLAAEKENAAILDKMRAYRLEFGS